MPWRWTWIQTECSNQRCRLGQADAGDRCQFFRQGARQAGQAAEGGQQGAREIDGALAGPPVAEDERKQFAFGQRFDPDCPQPLPRAFVRRKCRQHDGHIRDRTRRL